MALESTSRLGEPTDEILERLCEVFWNGGGEGVTISDKYSFDVINAVYSGTIDVDGTIYGFIIQDGNWNGTEVLEWGDPEDVGTYNPGQHEPMVLLPLAPLDSLSPEQLLRHMALVRTDEYNDLLVAYCHDMYYEPTPSMRSHYDKLLRERGVQIGYASDLYRIAGTYSSDPVLANFEHAVRSGLLNSLSRRNDDGESTDGGGVLAPDAVQAADAAADGDDGLRAG